jgi:hypothetical protein
MAEYPPYVGATGVLNSVLKKIIEAPPPPRFTQDFLTAKLGFKKGSGNAVIPFLKRIGFLGSDGVPTELYSRFRNPARGGYALGQGIKLGYSDLYSRNEYWHDLSKQDLTGLLIEATGAAPNSSTLKQILATIDVLKQYAKFDGHDEPIKDEPDDDNTEDEEDVEQQDGKSSRRRINDELGVNLSYTINLNLPETSDITVFDAIFKSLKENLLKK